MKALAREGGDQVPGGWSPPSDRINGLIILTGDEDGGVSVECYHPSCEPYKHGSIAYYGGLSPINGMPNFSSGQVVEFFEFIRQHVAAHHG
jgi:hypothetical protein